MNEVTYLLAEQFKGCKQIHNFIIPAAKTGKNVVHVEFPIAKYISPSFVDHSSRLICL